MTRSFSIRHGVALPASVTVLSAALLLDAAVANATQVTLSGARCDGAHDDTAAIQQAIDATPDGGTVTLPAGGTCLYGGELDIKNRRGLTISGSNGSQLRGTDQAHTALRVIDSANILLKNFQIVTTAATGRSSSPVANGVAISGSTGVTVTGMAIRGMAGGGIFVQRSVHLAITNDVIVGTRADGVHITGGSSDVTIRENRAERTGDDSFASVTYSGMPRNSDIRINDNLSQGSNASGITVAGSTRVKVSGNTITNSSAAGIRVESWQAYRTQSDDNVTITSNRLAGSPANTTRDHSAIMAFTNYQAIKALTVEHNTMIDPKARSAIRMYGTRTGHVSGARIDYNTVKDHTAARTVAVSLGVGTSNIVTKHNTISVSSQKKKHISKKKIHRKQKRHGKHKKHTKSHRG